MKKAAEDFPTAPGDGAQETTASPAAGWAPWEARLALRFDRDGDTTRLVGRSHFGPLRVQKALYPEQPAVCHAVVVHPPGGVVGGDRLFIDIDAGAGAHALLTTPGATKWYRASQLSASTGRPGVSSQVVRLAAGAGANLEWLPQETIFYNGAQVRLDTEIALGAGAQYIGCEVLCFGRTASGEHFDRGRVSQRTAIRQEGRLVWYEQGVLDGDGPAMASALGLAGKTVCATLVAVGKPLPASELAAMRERLAERFPQCGRQEEDHQPHERRQATARFGVTQMKSVLVARYLGDSSELAKQVMTALWQQLRPAMLGREAVPPRLWNT